MLPPAKPSKKPRTPYVEDHFSLWEDAWFTKMAEERAAEDEIDDLLDKLFPAG